MKYIIFIFSVIISYEAFAQKSPIAEINFYGDILNNAHHPDHRQMAFDSVSKKMDRYVHSEYFKYEDLKDLLYLSVTSPINQSFTLVSWQLNDGLYYHYDGYFITQERAYKLNDNFDKISDPEYSSLSFENWYGAIYYNVKEFTTDEKMYYVLFGYNGYKNHEHQKIAEVISLKDGVPIFGAEIFRKEKENKRADIKSRLILTYSKDANVTINYNAGLNMITLDHLVTRIGIHPGQGPTSLPDGSYVGYQWNKESGYFNYIDKIYNQTFDTPPGEVKMRKSSNQKKRDIMGRAID